MTTEEIAARITAHLQRFEADKDINPSRRFDKEKKKWVPCANGLCPYHYANAGANGRWVNIWYISYQGKHSLSKADAQRYLDWLDAGNVGRHMKALKT